MAYRDWLVFAYSPSADRAAFTGSLVKNYAGASDAFPAARDSNKGFKSRYGDVLIGGGAAASVPLIGTNQVNTNLVNLGDFNATNHTITLNPSGALKDVHFALQPGVPKGLSQVTYDATRQDGKNFVQTTIDTRLAAQSDIVYTASPIFRGTNLTSGTVTALYPDNTTVFLGPGEDVVWGGLGDDWIGGTGAWAAGAKLIIGDSNRDTIYGSSNGDYLVGDNFQNKINFYDYNAADKANSKYAVLNQGKLAGAFGQNFDRHVSLIKSTARNASGSGGSWNYTYRYLPQIDFSNSGAAAIKSGVLGSTSSPVKLNVWQPKGDYIHSGAGDDLVYGDNDLWDGQQLLNYKELFDGTADVSNGAMSTYIDAVWPFQNWDPVQKRYVTPKWSKAAPDSERLKLGNDELHAGVGNDVIYGGFGSDIISGGAGFDIIYAPTQVLVPGFDPLWNGPSVLYGGDMYAGDAITGAKDPATNFLSFKEIDVKRYGALKEGSSVTYSSTWLQGLTPEPDMFVIGSPIWTESQLKAFKSNVNDDVSAINEKNKTDQEFTSRFSTEALSDKAVDTFIDLIGAIPVIGDAASMVLGMIKRWLDWPSVEPKEPAKPAEADKFVMINDFDIWDTLVIQRSVNDGQVVNVQAFTSDPGKDAIQFKYGQRNDYNPSYESNLADSTVVTVGANEGAQSVYLRGFNYKTATSHLIKCMQVVFDANKDNPNKDKAGFGKTFLVPSDKLDNDGNPMGIGVQGMPNYLEPGTRVDALQLIKALNDSWDTSQYWSRKPLKDFGDPNMPSSAPSGAEAFVIQSRLFDDENLKLFKSFNLAPPSLF